MKLVIYTQYRENYGAHDWDGTGTCPQYWKSKGGSTYVVASLTPAQVLKIKDSGIPTLTSLIEYANDYTLEYVINYRVVPDSTSVCEEWESPIMLDYNPLAGKWYAREVRENGEYGCMRKEIDRLISTWTLAPKGETNDRVVTYVMRNGDIVKGSDIDTYFTRDLEVA